ncbi:hypothetical protein [Rubinisphaera margarita]|uniref:hypothetical protein n=1 Tax=Rubinisphaera margarita TaxID=2909586 RepID=UPI001EE80753|nr:hypothetical protein [Rubinisphaera margarita]MCG6157683.1 hypothetical protein [Rubinisphaera margarita]
MLFLLLSSTSGCGGGSDDGIQTLPVAGTVTLNGQPLAEAIIQFQPQNGEGRSSAGRTDETGRFELLFDSDREGALPGEHRVMITAVRELPGKQDEEGNTLTEQILPAQYNARSTLTAQVSENTEHYDFALKSK